MKVKTIDVNAKEWFDRINGNSYFSAIVTVNFGMKTEKTFVLPFQYGYGEHYIDMAKKELEKQGLISGVDRVLSWWCRDNGIIFRASKQTGCLKRELTQ